jgi:hypothetical protein
MFSTYYTKMFYYTHFTDMCTPHFFSLSNGVRRSTFDAGLVTKIWRLFKFKFSDVNINSQCLVLNDRSIDENLKRRQIL